MSTSVIAVLADERVFRHDQDAVGDFQRLVESR